MISIKLKVGTKKYSKLKKIYLVIISYFSRFITKNLNYVMDFRDKSFIVPDLTFMCEAVHVIFSFFCLPSHSFDLSFLLMAYKVG